MALLGAVFGLLILLGWRQVDSLDVGFHLAAGEAILDGEGWPRQDTFTYTVNDRAYTDTSWGYQVILAACRRAGGAPAMTLLHVWLLVAIFGVTAWSARAAGAGIGSVAAYLLLGVLAAEMRFAVRPEFVSYALFALLVALLDAHSRGRRIPLWLVPLTMLVWVNLHGLFVLGWIAVAAYALAAVVEGRADRRFLAWCAASVPATLVNPYGLQGTLFPFTLATRMQESNVFRHSIGEFVSPFDLGLSARHPFYPEMSVLCFRLLAVLAVIAAVRAAMRRRWGPVVLVIATLLLSTKMIRNIPILVVASLPVIATMLPPERLLRFRSAVARRRAATAVVALAGIFVAVAGLRVVRDAHYVDDRRPQRFGAGWNRQTLPVDLAQWARRTQPDGNLLNQLNFGGYLHWALDRPVYIDGRLEVMGEKFFEHYRSVLGSLPAMQREVERRDIGWMAFPYRSFPGLLGRVSSDQRWRLAYVDPVGVAFRRAGPAKPADPGVARWFSAGFDAGGLSRLPGLGGGPRSTGVRRLRSLLATRADFPTEQSSRGLFHLYRGDNPRAAAAFMEAIAVSDGAFYELYNNLGAVLWRMGRLEEAAACYRVVLEERPADALAQERSNPRP